MKRLSIILLCVVAAMLLAGKLFDHAYKKYWSTFFEKLDVVIKDSTHYDGIYLGDSRVHFGINPYYVDSVTGMKTYNAGMGGATIAEINFLAKQYMSKNRYPEFAVICIGYSDILTTDKFFENLCFYFFYTDNKTTDSTLQNLGYHTTLYKFLPVLKYTAFDEYNKLSIAENIKGNTFLKEGGTAYNGFINNSRNSFNVQLLKNFEPEDKPIDKSIALLEETIKLFIDKNTLPILVYPPATHHNQKGKAPVEIKIDSAVSLLARKYQTPILHFDTDTAFTNDFFSDPWHVNLQGSVLFSQKLGQQINGLLKK